MFARNRKIGLALDWVKRALQNDPDNWQALKSGGALHLEAKRYEQALNMAAASLALVYHQPLMHYVMGHALMGMRDYSAAEQPLRLALLQTPGFVRAHELLSRLYADHLNRLGDAGPPLRSRGTITRKPQSKTTGSVRRTGSIGRTVSDRARRAVSRPIFPHRSGKSAAEPEREVVVVCGLPRSGTSMLMQMLAAGGVLPLTDGVRAADEDNPRGYFEYERATRPTQDARWVAQARGKAVKLVLPLVPFLRPQKRIG